MYGKARIRDYRYLRNINFYIFLVEEGQRLLLSRSP